MLKIKKDMVLQETSLQSFVVPVGKMSEEFHGMLRLNKTGVLYWRALEKGASKEELVRLALDTFDDIDEKKAAGDVEEFLDSIRPYLEEF